jgi:hypothetical protein
MQAQSLGARDAVRIRRQSAHDRESLRLTFVRPAAPGLLVCQPDLLADFGQSGSDP